MHTSKIAVVVLAALLARNNTQAIAPLQSSPGYAVTAHTWRTPRLIPSGARLRFYHEHGLRVVVDGRACPVVSEFESVCETIHGADSFAIEIQSPGVPWLTVLVTANAGRVFERIWITHPSAHRTFFPWISVDPESVE